jgi:hypothetical protein
LTRDLHPSIQKIFDLNIVDIEVFINICKN